ncbi:MAG: methionine--tRNA ligase [Anaerocolumna sp.]|jgi:methionyl-tRNA synthetase|nr:methionine--tRNA ligase [Anaerocolumna sp.]
MMNKILIGGAWPYANGSLHIGHVAGLLPGDVIARYHRAIGNEVFYVSGSDCHGTPVTVRAKQEDKSPEAISDLYHREFCQCFDKLGFSYDLYGKTSSEEHKSFVRQFHTNLYRSEYVYEKVMPQAYCETCNQFLPDRYVEGLCPICGEKARGDQCDLCGAVLEPEILLEPRCTICGCKPTFKDSKHLFIAISKLEKELKLLVDSHSNWRKNAITFTNRYIKEGLRDRALTRDLDWGIDVPYEGYEGKKIYIWAENVLGYLSMSAELAKLKGIHFKDLWGEGTKHYYVHAKDNIPFHTIILPALLICEGSGYHLPDEIISNEYLTLEGHKISTSQNWAIWVKDIINRYNPDAIRYFLIANGPVKRDTDFSWNEFIKSNNSELLGGYGNFVNRTVVFIQKYYNSFIPQGSIENGVKNRIEETFNRTGECIGKGDLKPALELVFELVRFANKYFDDSAPWVTRTENSKLCENTMFNCIQLTANLGVLMAPFLPFSSNKLFDWFKVDNKWCVKLVPSGFQIPKTDILFERIDKSIVAIEREKLGL